jgi:hypothetical protein
MGFFRYPIETPSDGTDYVGDSGNVGIGTGGLFEIHAMPRLHLYTMTPKQAVECAGGVRIGDGLFPLNFSAPAAKLVATQAQLIIRVSFFLYRRNWEFSRAAVDRVADYDGLISKGLRIVHHCTDKPSFLVFWVMQNRAELKAQLQSLGYRVE